MERRPVSGYVYIGTAIRYLIDCSAGGRIFGEAFVLDNIGELFEKLDEYDLHVTSRVLHRLRLLADEWKEESVAHAEEPDWEASRRLTTREATDLTGVATSGRDTLLAEADGKIAYIAEDKRYTVEKLTRGMPTLFARDTFDQLPAIAQDDFVSAGRAIAFMLPTAGAFHILRGAEAALREYYARFVRRGRIAEPRMWGPIVTDLKSKSSPAPELLTTSLDSLRKHFRNPTQHPEKTYDIDEVQDLLATAIDVVNQMYRHLRSVGR